MTQIEREEEETIPWSGRGTHELHRPGREGDSLGDLQRNQGGSAPERSEAEDSSPTPSWLQTQENRRWRNPGPKAPSEQKEPAIRPHV